MAVLSNFALKCTAIAPYLENSTITGVALQIGGYTLRVRNPKFEDFTITGSQSFQGISKGTLTIKRDTGSPETDVKFRSVFVFLTNNYLKLSESNVESD